MSIEELIDDTFKRVNAKVDASIRNLNEAMDRLGESAREMRRTSERSLVLMLLSVVAFVYVVLLIFLFSSYSLFPSPASMRSMIQHSITNEMHNGSSR